MAGQLLKSGLICLFLLTGFSVCGYAQLTELVLFSEEDLVITASKHLQKASEAPATIDVVTSADIERFGLRTLGDALRLFAGIDVADGIVGMVVSPRGLGEKMVNNTILCMVDGHPYNEIIGGHVDPAYIPLSHVERIEVIRGPGSALYGANAFCGVINIITKSAKDVDGIKLSVSRGRWDTQTQELLYGKQGEKVNGLFSFRHYKTHGIGGNTVNDNDDKDDFDFFGKLQTQNLTLSIEHYQVEFGMPGSERFSMLNDRDKFRRNFLILDYNQNLTSKLELKFLTHLFKTDEEGIFENLYTGVMEEETIDGQRIGLETQAHYQICPKNLLISGVEWKQEKSDCDKIGGEQEITDKAFYFQHELKMFDIFTFTMGGRYDIPSVYEEVFSPRFNIISKLSDTTVLKTAYGEAFRSPNFRELYNDLLYAGMIHYVGNPDLETEKIKTTEVGLLHSFSKNFQANVNLFHTNAENMIIQQVSIVPPGIYQIDYLNQNKAEIQGGEISLRYRVASTLGAFINYSYQEAKDKDTEEELAYAPKHKVNVRFNIRLSERIRLNTLTYYVGEEWASPRAAEVKVGDYAVTNAKLNINLNRNVDLSLSAYNLFDREYSEIEDYPLAGRNVMAKVEYKF
jgi:iron complex outermembrane receptor protein